MDWADTLATAAGITFVSGFALLIITGHAHGGKNQMSLWDPALKNEISKTGVKWVGIAGALIATSVIAGIISILINKP